MQVHDELLFDDEDRIQRPVPYHPAAQPSRPGTECAWVPQEHIAPLDGRDLRLRNTLAVAIVSMATVAAGLVAFLAA